MHGASVDEKYLIHKRLKRKKRQRQTKIKAKCSKSSSVFNTVWWTTIEEKESACGWISNCIPWSFIFFCEKQCPLWVRFFLRHTSSDNVPFTSASPPHVLVCQYKPRTKIIAAPRNPSANPGILIKQYFIFLCFLIACHFFTWSWDFSAFFKVIPYCASI